MKKINLILFRALESISPSEEELKEIEIKLKKFLEQLKKRIRRLNISAEIFVGGSFAKGTVIKKEKYDIDIFLRFDKKYDKNLLSSLAEKILNFGDFKKIHGSRDYFRIAVSKNIIFEIIPVRKIKTPKEAENITDLSYFHVNFIKKKLKSKKILDEVRLAKAFCYSHKCYGAESYIRGFSGYGLEILVYYYGGFLNFIKNIAKADSGKIIIDVGKFYKNKNSILMDLNAAKLDSPIILIDPTYKHRNLLAALSEERFLKFQKACKNFLAKPDLDAFSIKEIDFENLKKNSRRKKQDFVLMEAETDKQEGDIAGSKLLKFYSLLSNEIKKYFEIKASEFEYRGEKTANFFFSVKSRREIILFGPFLKDKKNSTKFRKKHKKVFEKRARLYAKEKINFNLREFLNTWKKENKDCMIDMNILQLKVKI
ncbi:hypothetical protein FJZ20_00720 [Candidatus Pacearchaeota archaeon]|nr:hypothetical protein [Candidatus Pacearchaeota archaeon]